MSRNTNSLRRKIYHFRRGSAKVMPLSLQLVTSFWRDRKKAH